MPKIKRVPANEMTFAFSSRDVDEAYIAHLESTAGHVVSEVLHFSNKGDRSLTEIYNEVLRMAKNDIIVFCHDDLIFETQGWAENILRHFRRSPDYGILGIAGTDHLMDGRWWSIKNAMHGIVNHSEGGKTWTNAYSEPQGIKIKRMIVVDGLFFAVNRRRIKSKFDESFKGFHLYDVSFCVKNHLAGVKIGVITDVRVTHLSVGRTNAQWAENRAQFEREYGSVLPLKI